MSMNVEQALQWILLRDLPGDCEEVHEVLSAAVKERDELRQKLAVERKDLLASLDDSVEQCIGKWDAKNALRNVTEERDALRLKVEALEFENQALRVRVQQLDAPAEMITVACIHEDTQDCGCTYKIEPCGLHRRAEFKEPR